MHFFKVICNDIVTLKGMAKMYVHWLLLVACDSIPHPTYMSTYRWNFMDQVWIIKAGSSFTYMQFGEVSRCWQLLNKIDVLIIPWQQVEYPWRVRI